MATDLFSVAGKVVCVSGSSRGLGKAIARAFAERGARVIVSGWEDAEVAQTKREFRALGLPVEAVTFDAQVEADCSRLVTAALDAHGTLDVMICNAGTDVIKPAEQYEEAEWDSILDTNLRGYYYCARYAARHML